MSEIEVDAKLILTKQLKLKTTTNEIFNSIINIFECENPYVIVIVITKLSNNSIKNDSFRIDIFENDLSKELNQWLKGKLINHPCYNVTAIINESINNFIKYQQIPKQEHLLMWILSRIEIILDSDYIAYFGGLEGNEVTKDTNININTFNESRLYNSLNNKITNSNYQTDNNRPANTLTKSINQLNKIEYSTYKLTNQLLGKSQALNSLRQSKVKGRDGARVATKALTTSQYVLGADIEYTRKQIEKTIDERRKTIVISNIRKQQQIEKYNKIKNKLDSIKNNISWDNIAYNELMLLHKTKDEIERDIIKQRIKSQKESQMIAWTKAPPGFSNLRGKSQSGVLLGPGPLPFDATTSQRDPRVELTLKKYYWDEFGRRHILEKSLNDDESLIDKAFHAIKRVSKNASSYKLNLKEVFDCFDSSGDGYLTIDELGEAFLALGVPLDIETLNVLFNHFDSNQSGSIHYGEFLWAFFNRSSFVRKYKNNTKSLNESQIKSIFHKHDTNGDGLLNKKEFMRLLNYFNIKMDSNQLDILISKFDKNQDGDIDVYEFKEFIDNEINLLYNTSSNVKSKSVDKSLDKTLDQSTKKPVSTNSPVIRKQVNKFVDNESLSKIKSVEIKGSSDSVSVEDTVWLSQLFQAQASIESKLEPYYK